MEIATYQRDQDSDRLFTRSKLDKKHARSRNDKVVTVHRYDGISFIFISLCFREYRRIYLRQRQIYSRETQYYSSGSVNIGTWNIFTVESVYENWHRNRDIILSNPNLIWTRQIVRVDNRNSFAIVF